MTSDYAASRGTRFRDLADLAIESVEQALGAEDYDCLTVEAVQDALGRSRASIYRYANTTTETLNPPFDQKRLNPELRKHKDDPLLFHPSEVERFARDILGIQQVTIEVQVSEPTVNQSLLREILQELKGIRLLLEEDTASPTSPQSIVDGQPNGSP
ncbi:MAG: hypothetical protein ACFB4J_07450 [Elainellaceae cyanobacterium]